MSNPALGSLDWNLVRSFVAVVETGSLTGAARHLELAHPTVARHVQQLETALGLTLFDRRPTGLVLNPAGARLAASARGMRESARAFEQVTAAVRTSASGLVRITAAEGLATVLPRLLAPLRGRDSQARIQVDLLIANDQLNLLQQEADIAIRHVEPQQQDLIARRLADLPYGLFASPEYVAEHGPPRMGTLGEHRIVDGVMAPRFARYAERLGTPLHRDQFVLRTDSFTAQLHAARAGWGIAALPLHVAEEVTGLVRVLRDSPFQHVGMWLVGRPEVRSVAYLHEAFGTVAETLNRFAADVRARDPAPPERRIIGVR
jgi:DNA-binding transcriptional LysR family regulator